MMLSSFADEKGRVLKKDIPILLETINIDLVSEQLAIEKDIVESRNDETKEEDNPDEDVCPICLEEIAEDEMEVLGCDHEYHKTCISEWMRRNPVCPECRAYIKLVEEFPPLTKT